LDLNGSAEDYQWSETKNGKPTVAIRAKTLRQEKDSARAELEGVKLNIYAKDGQHYDLVKSAKATFNQLEGKLISNGEVDITLNVPIQGEPGHRLTSVHSAGMTFESKSGKASTDQPTPFTFENGDGKCVGATYDPATRELHLLKQVEMHLRGAGPKSKPMKIESGELTYKEAQSAIWLSPWSRLTRDQTVINAGASTINMKDREIQSIDSQQARGVDTFPKRQLDYSADGLHVAYSEEGEIQKITGTGNARLVSKSEGSETTMTSTVVDLDFAAQNGESVLTQATGNGNGVVESKPSPSKDGKTPENRVLRSEVIQMHMRPGGRDLEMVETHTPGVLEFLPNQPADRRRLMHGERITIQYGAQNQIQSFRSVNVATETFPSETVIKTALAAKKPAPAMAKTGSVNLSAEFDPKTGKMTRMKQWDNFHYEEADRRARSSTATLDSEHNVMDLETGARVWDATGSTDADHIKLAQSNGDFTADGHVNTSRLPESKSESDKGASDILDSDEPTQGTAQHMTSQNRNRLVHYEGNAVLWQGSNRIESDRIDIDREKRNLIATGHVTTQFLDDRDDDENGKAPPPVFTVVHSAKLVYTEQDRLAHYTGGVQFERPGLSVKGAELRSYLNDKNSNADSRFEKAIADGKVVIVQTAADRKRTGMGEHAEYYTANEKIILRGGDPQLLDSKRGNTRGAELTYFANDDRLLVSGAPQKPVNSRLRRK
ncbi:MAG: LPS export ABC transporter periplasmic protein LptC, partial [Acidobacteriota bacterium]|nr:LPS export ABC transporter periplasmic protein LptC [Acidobacteriota bacterium]